MPDLRSSLSNLDVLVFPPGVSRTRATARHANLHFRSGVNYQTTSVFLVRLLQDLCRLLGGWGDTTRSSPHVSTLPEVAKSVSLLALIAHEVGTLDGDRAMLDVAQQLCFESGCHRLSLALLSTLLAGPNEYVCVDTKTCHLHVCAIPDSILLLYVCVLLSLLSRLVDAGWVGVRHSILLSGDETTQSAPSKHVGVHSDDDNDNDDGDNNDGSGSEDPVTSLVSGVEAPTSDARTSPLTNFGVSALWSLLRRRDFSVDAAAPAAPVVTLLAMDRTAFASMCGRDTVLGDDESASVAAMLKLTTGFDACAAMLLPSQHAVVTRLKAAMVLVLGRGRVEMGTARRRALECLVALYGAQAQKLWHAAERRVAGAVGAHVDSGSGSVVTTADEDARVPFFEIAKLCSRLCQERFVLWFVAALVVSRPHWPPPCCPPFLFSFLFPLPCYFRAVCCICTGLAWASVLPGSVW